MTDDEVPIANSMFGDFDSKIENFGDLVFKISPPIYRFFVHFIPQCFYDVKYFFQRIIRKHHSADIDLWGLDYHLARIILPKLKAFRSRDLHGHPASFCDWDENIGISKEDYDKNFKEGVYVGGGQDAWLKTLDEMIYAFEYLLYSDSFDKKQKQFFEKYGYLDPYRETDDNLSWGWNYKSSDGGRMSCGERLSEEEEKSKGVIN